MQLFRKKLLERFGGMEYSWYFCIRFREHRHAGCLRDSKRWRSLKGLHRQRSSTRANFHIIYSVEDLGRTTVQFLDKEHFR